MKVHHSIWWKIWKTQEATGLERSVFILIPKKGTAKECSNYCTITSNYWGNYRGNFENFENCSKFSIPGFSSMWTKNFQMFKQDLEKQRSNCQHLLDHRKSKRISEKHLLLLHWLAKAFDCVDNNKLWTILQEMGIPDHLTCLLKQQNQTRNNGQVPNWERSTSSVYIILAYLNYMQSTSWEMPDWMKHKLEKRLLGKYQ